LEIVMADTDRRRGQRVQFAGIGLTLGAGVGILVGALVGGGAVAVGIVVGAGVGLVVGAAIEAQRGDQAQ
jgi:hypothetical protein